MLLDYNYLRINLMVITAISQLVNVQLMFIYS